MSRYVTVQGDTFDNIAYKVYGNERHMKALIEANWPLLETYIFPGGIEVDCPELPDDDAGNAPFWRSEDSGGGSYDYDVDGSEDLTEGMQDG